MQLLFFTGGALALGPVVAVPESELAVVYQIPAALRGLGGAIVTTDGNDALAQAKASLEQFSATANPRFLGDAQAALNRVAVAGRDARFFLYRAAYHQSLHEFDQAAEDIRRGLAVEPQHRSLRLMQFNIAFVQGLYEPADEACEALAALAMDLYAASCRQQLVAAQGDADEAFAALQAGFAEAVFTADGQQRHWASSSLADIAERAGRFDRAEALWRVSLGIKPDDIYARARLCQLLILNGGREGDAMALTEEYLQVDDLAVCHAIALQRSGAEATALIDDLTARFDEAVWRGEVLHKRAYGQFLLALKNQPVAALAVAEANWQHQREWPDQRLLKSAKDAVEAAN